MESSSTKEVMTHGEVDKINFFNVPVRALRLKTRTILSSHLNALQVIPSQSGSPRDYRGLADLFGLDNSSMSTIDRSPDPMKVIFEIVEKEMLVENYGKNRRPYTFQDLIHNLEIIERFDIIDDVMELLKEDAEFHQQKMQRLPRKNLAHKRLTIDDQDENRHYDAYICYADEDIEFVTSLAEYLESPSIGLRLFIRDRDLLLGTMRYDAYTRLIEERCNYVVIILTPEFVESEECKYQTLFATDLAIQDRERKLIPIILRPCNIPPFVRLMSKIDFSREDSKWDWIWRKLIVSISSKPQVMSQLPPYPRITTMNNFNSNALTYPQHQSQQQKQSLPTQQPISSFNKPRSGSKSTSNGIQTANSINDNLLSSSLKSIDFIPSLPSVPSTNPFLKLDSRELKDDSFDSGRAETISSIDSSTSAVSLSNGKDWKKGMRFFQTVKQKIVSPFSSSEPSYNGYNCLSECNNDLK